VFDTDEHVRMNATIDDMTKLRAVFQKDGTVTAGNASGLNDAAAATVLMERSVAEKKGLKPLARLVAYGHAGVDPKIMGIGPVPAVQNAMKRAGLTVAQMDVIESNEAFAAQSVRRRPERPRLRRREDQPERRRNRPGSSDRCDRLPDHHQGAVRTAADRRAVCPRDDVHRWRPGHRRHLRADLSSPQTPWKPPAR
jgi:hypothetical protein